MANQPIGEFHENSVNYEVGKWLNTVGRDWNASGERTGVVVNSHTRPDIVIRQGDRMPVIVEAEWDKPAIGDATSRLGATLEGETRPFTEIIALGYDITIRNNTPEQLLARLNNNERMFTIQLVTENGASPKEPLSATPDDLIAYCEYAQVPQSVIDFESEQIAREISSAGQQLLNGIELSGNLAPQILKQLRETLGCEKDLDAARTACAIWLVAIDLQNDLATYSPALQDAGLKTTRSLRTDANDVLTPEDLLTQWKVVEGVNYLPVMELSIDSLQAVDIRSGLTDVLRALDNLSARLNGLHAKHIYNFPGELWQRLVSDREERAAHYTKPENAELLATLAAQRFQNWDRQRIAEINLMDASCGTGTLVGAGERALRRLYAQKGGRDPELHRKRIEEHIIALDVNSIAGTLTAKRLSDMNVAQDYSKSKIAVVSHMAGSLMLLDPTISGINDLLGFGGIAATPGLSNEPGLIHVLPSSVQWSLMNPPYSRPRKDREQATKGLSRLRQIAAKAGFTMSDGQAGLGSDFGNMTNIRLEEQGVYSHVLPLTAAHAESWQGWRAQLEEDFEDIIAIANVGPSLESMSADTGMNEMLVVATKRRRTSTIRLAPSRWQPTSILCVNLSMARTTLAEGYAIAQEIGSIPPSSQYGMLQHGSYVRATTPTSGFPWFALGNENAELTATVVGFLNGNAFDPVKLETHGMSLSMTTLGDMASSGPTHHLIGYPKDGDPIGAFEWTPLTALPSRPAQQALWAANSKTQISILAEPTHGGTVVDQHAAQQMVAKRGVWHFSRNLRFTSQSIAVAKTSRPVHGGRAWNALQELPDSVGQCLALYYNSIFGAIMRNAYGQSTQAGRATIQVLALQGMPCPAFHVNTQEARTAREIAEKHFSRLLEIRLQPFAYCFRDDNRREIDDVVAEMLGLDPTTSEIQEMMEHYRVLFASEPNVNGHQKSIVAALEQYRKGK